MNELIANLISSKRNEASTHNSSSQVSMGWMPFFRNQESMSPSKISDEGCKTL